MGDKLALMVTQRREQKELVLYVNEQQIGVVASGLPERVFGFIQLYYSRDSMSLVSDLREVRRHIKLCSCRRQVHRLSLASVWL